MNTLEDEEDKNLAVRLFTPLDEAEVDATAPDDALLVVVTISLFCKDRERAISNYEAQDDSLLSLLQRERKRTKRAKKEQKPSQKEQLQAAKG